MLALSQINYSIMEWINAAWAIVTNLLYVFGNKDSITYYTINTMIKTATNPYQPSQKIQTLIVIN